MAINCGNLFGVLLPNKLCSLEFLQLCVLHLGQLWFVTLQSG